MMAMIEKFFIFLQIMNIKCDNVMNEGGGGLMTFDDEGDGG